MYQCSTIKRHINFFHWYGERGFTAAFYAIPLHCWFMHSKLQPPLLPLQAGGNIYSLRQKRRSEIALCSIINRTRSCGGKSTIMPFAKASASHEDSEAREKIRPVTASFTIYRTRQFCFCCFHSYYFIKKSLCPPKWHINLQSVSAPPALVRECSLE